MVATVNIYSNKKGELNKFLSHFYNTDLDIENELKWEKSMKILLNWLKLLVFILITQIIICLICGFL